MKRINNERVIQANIELHSRLAHDYSTCEPHFKAENLEHVENKLRSIFSSVQAVRLLDLGCGTGFIINLAKRHLKRIDGVDVTAAMLAQVNLEGPCEINLFQQDTGSFVPESGAYDVVTGYSFLHHLYDVRPTLETAYTALRPGGVLYCDLDPNFYFWEQICNLKRDGLYSPVVKREIEMVAFKDEDIEENWGVSKEVFNNAEFGKNIKGGFREEELREVLLDIGYSEVEFEYFWFIGQSRIVNEEGVASKDERLENASIVNQVLVDALPLSRTLFKYVGFVARK